MEKEVVGEEAAVEIVVVDVVAAGVEEAVDASIPLNFPTRSKRAVVTGPIFHIGWL